MHLRTARDLGLVIRERRRALGLDQASLAQRVGASRQWVIEIEAGKPRAEVGLVLRAFRALGLELQASPEDATAVVVAEGGRPYVSTGEDIDAIVEAHRSGEGEA